MLIGIHAGLLLMACSEQKDMMTESDTYPFANPIVVDTVYTSEYVADIQSLQNVEIRSRVKGFIETINVDEGKEVKAGQVLFTINSQFYREEVSKTTALLKSAVAESKAAELDLRNIQLLVEKSVVSKTELEMAHAKLEAAMAKVDEAKSNQAAAVLNLSLTEIRAPFDGMINRIPNKKGSIVDEGTLLTTISNNKEMYAYFNVSEREYLDYDSQNTINNLKVNLVLANSKLYPISGIIETIEGEINKETGNIAFRARFANPHHTLRHGASGKILLRRELKNALVIPQKSTFEIQENTYVFVIDKDNVARLRKVNPKFRIDNMYVIESGLSTADRVVLEGLQLIKDGEKVNPRNTGLMNAFAG